MKSLGLDRLSVDERLQLAEELWESVVAEEENRPLSAAQQQDLQNRLDSAAEDPTAGTPWEEVRQRLLRNE